MTKRFLLLLAVAVPIMLRGQQGATPAGGAGVVTITYTDYAFSAPDILPAGYTTFRAVNHGKELHHATLIMLGSGKTLQDFLQSIQQKVAPTWAATVGGLQNSGQVGIELTPGNYIWWCFMPGPDGKPHSGKGMYKGFSVRAAHTSAKPPVADIVMTMKDYSWDVTQLLTAGHHVLKLVNAPGQAHEFMLVRLVPGKYSSDFLAWLDKQTGPRPFLSIEGIPSLKTGFVNYVTVDLKPGRYMVASFNPDARDGKPQLLHGMVREIVIK